MDNLCNEFVSQFDKEFSGLKNKKIVLYGIGYRTEALLDCLKGKYDFIGLMDREESNIGKSYFGYKVLDNATVIREADCIIIISVSFYDVIYNRISWLSSEYGIDIFFPNGVKAVQVMEEYEEFDAEYKILNMESAKERMKFFDTISFDFFDTLCMRKVLDSDVIFEVMDFWLQKDGINFYKNRKQAYAEVCKSGMPTLERIYACFQLLSGLSDEKVREIKEMEIETEKRFWVMRQDMAKLLRYVQEIGKRIFIITDMYIPSEILYDFLEEHHIKIQKDNLIVSGEYQMDKESGRLWKWFVQERGTECGKILHIGDNLQSDILSARKYGINTMHILSAKDIMRHTVYNRILKRDLSLWGKLAMGLIGERLFNSPFIDDRIDREGRVRLKSEQEIGYIGYGCLIRSFLGYIMERSREMDINKMLFCARDGYLLKHDFDELLKVTGNCNIETKYFKTSRQLVRRAALFNDRAIDDFVNMPYRGNEKDFFRLRTGLEFGENREIEMPRDKEQVKDRIDRNKNIIKDNSRKLRENYISYINNEIGGMDRAALVDFGYSGSTQYYLSQILNEPLTGIYLLADMDEENEYNRGQNKVSFIYDENDPKGGKSLMAKCFLLLESVFTAPYGTYLSCDSRGNFETGEKKQNNILFSMKEKINDGVLEFLFDVGWLLGNDIDNFDFRDEIGVELLTIIFENKKVNIDKKMLDTFYSDDILRYQTDRRIFD